MIIPTGFQFSQSSLQDFSDCRRRFQLRYLMRLAWPAAEAEPVLENEFHIQAGIQFHQMVHQYLLGVPTERINYMHLSDDLSQWWENYLASVQEEGILQVIRQPDTLSFPEVSLSASVGEYHLIAKYDLVTVLPTHQVTIYDWKTSHTRPKRKWLVERLQTRVYPYLIIQAGKHLNRNSPIRTEQLEMIYWFSSFPDQPERFTYSQKQFLADQEYLTGLVKTIQRLGQDEFSLTNDEKHCRYCIYRSLCDRGIKAGSLEGFADEGDQLLFNAWLDFEQIEEIEF